MLSNTMLDGVLYCLCFCFSCILLPGIILLTQMLCPSPLQYTVDPMLLPSRNLGKNAMERFRGLLPDIILLTQCYPILCLMGYYIACVLHSGIIMLTQMLCPSPRQYTVDPMLTAIDRGTRVKKPWRGFVVAGFVFVAFYPN